MYGKHRVSHTYFLMEVNMDYTIAEDFTLPSLGKIYPVTVNPNIKLRSMTTAEEMKRLSVSDTPFKVFCEIIDDCMIQPCGISSYDMCVGDYQYLIQKLRIVTYGPDYKLTSTCPYCGIQNTDVVDLDTFEVDEYSDDLNELFAITLPVSKKQVEINYQTPRMLDNINKRKREILKKSGKDADDPSLVLTLQAIIKTVDGQPLNVITSDNFVRSLNMRDVNKILNAANKLNNKIGLKIDLTHEKCNGCGLDYEYPFRITGEFFGPTDD